MGQKRELYLSLSISSQSKKGITKQNILCLIKTLKKKPFVQTEKKN